MFNKASLLSMKQGVVAVQSGFFNITREVCQMKMDNLMRLWIIVVIFSLAVIGRSTNPVMAGGIRSMEVIKSSGNWELRVGNDTFSGDKSCIIVQKNDYNIQINVGSLYVSYNGRGGIDGYKFRIDEAPPSEMQLPSKLESQTGAIEFSGTLFNRIISAHRLRVQAVTLIRGLVGDDIDLSGVSSLYQTMQSICVAE